MCEDIAKDKSKPEIPKYWKSFIEDMNKLNSEQRAVYAELENQIEIIL